MAGFGACVRKHFAFLIDDFGFALTSADDPVRYDGARLYGEVWWDKGQIDLAIGVRGDTEVIRPYVSHRFSIAEIVRYYKTGPFPTLDAFPPMPEVAGEERHVIYLAGLAKQYCGDIFRGDIVPLERLSQNRGAKHAS
jgi:hypothetical protein